MTYSVFKAQTHVDSHIVHMSNVDPGGAMICPQVTGSRIKFSHLSTACRLLCTRTNPRRPLWAPKRSIACRRQLEWARGHDTNNYKDHSGHQHLSRYIIGSETMPTQDGMKRNALFTWKSPRWNWANTTTELCTRFGCKRRLGPINKRHDESWMAGGKFWNRWLPFLTSN